MRTRAIGCLAAVLTLAGCGQLAATPPAVPGATAANTASKRAVPWIYVANGSYRAPSVTAYARGADGNAVPVRTIAGSHTQLIEPNGLVVDERGKLYVTNLFAGSNGYGSILIFAPGTNGNTAPIATIDTGLDVPFGVALDTARNVYVANWQGQSITEYAAGTYQVIRKISGDNTGLYPVGIALDSGGKIYAINDTESSGSSWVTVYAGNATGNATPLRTIEGPKTKLTNALGGIAVDAKHEIVVTNSPYPGIPSILVFAARANGNVKPIRTIGGSKTGLTNYPGGLTLDGSGKIYVTQAAGSESPGTVLVFAANARGNTAPIQVISGPETGLRAPTGISVR